MSTYQYYEFQAVDRALTPAEQDALRKLSTRADITSSRFVNVYNDGEEEEVVEPPVPPGLGESSPALRALAEFLFVPRDLVAAAAKASPARVSGAVPKQALADWLSFLRDLAQHRGTLADFQRRFMDLRERNARRQGLMRRMNEAGLGTV